MDETPVGRRIRPPGNRTTRGPSKKAQASRGTGIRFASSSSGRAHPMRRAAEGDVTMMGAMAMREDETGHRLISSVIDPPPGMWTAALRLAAQEQAPLVRVLAFRDPASRAVTYLVYDEATRIGVVIDPVATSSGAPCEPLVEAIDSLAIDLQFALETHLHDEHRSAAPYFARRHGAQVVAGARCPIREQALGSEGATPSDESEAAFDLLLEDGDVLAAGPLRIEVLATPGHTPACTSYRIGEQVFVGDLLSFPGDRPPACGHVHGTRQDLRRSLARLLGLDHRVRFLPGHDQRTRHTDRTRSALGHADLLRLIDRFAATV